MSLVTMMLTGCRVDLHTKLDESDANDMLAVLADAGIDAGKKTPDNGKSWTIEVEESRLASAVRILKANGLPQQRYASLGDIFKKEGLLSTPTEERVRFIHGVSQELASTLSQIDGVLVARVHVVLPDNDPLSPKAKPTSASVFIKHRPEANISLLEPKIRSFVMRSVEGLSYENVSVTMVSTTAAERQSPAGMAAEPAALHTQDQARLWLVIALAIVAALGTIAAGLTWWGRSEQAPSWLKHFRKWLPAIPGSHRARGNKATTTTLG